MTFSFVAFVVVSLVSEPPLVRAILALEIVRADVQVGRLVGELRVKVCFAAAATFAFDGAA